jgi:hypothetical protein
MLGDHRDRVKETDHQRDLTNRRHRASYNRRSRSHVRALSTTTWSRTRG